MSAIELPERPRGLRFAHNRGLAHQFEVQAADDTTDITIYDEIGLFGVSASDMRRQLDQVRTPNIRLRVNSPGGDVFDGIAIHNDLLQHEANVQVSITGVAASAASVIAMAGDDIEIAETGFIMVHNAWALAIGDKNDMRDLAGVLDQIDGALAKAYAHRTGETSQAMAALMDAETWMDGEAAVAAGFAGSIAGEESAQALFDFSMFNKVPERLKRQVETGLREAGYSRKEARDAASAGFHCLTQREAGEGRHRQREADLDGIAAEMRAFNARVRQSIAA